jgi:hypothetical protein
MRLLFVLGDPKVVVFDGSSLRKRPAIESKAAKKAFLVSGAERD